MCKVGSGSILGNEQLLTWKDPEVKKVSSVELASYDQVPGDWEISFTEGRSTMLVYSPNVKLYECIVSPSLPCR